MTDNQTTKRQHPARVIILDRELRQSAQRTTLYDLIAWSILIGGGLLLFVSLLDTVIWFFGGKHFIGAITPLLGFFLLACGLHLRPWARPRTAQKVRS